jgi:hypothetical protein
LGMVMALPQAPYVIKIQMPLNFNIAFKVKFK